jgi:hypothetical protein
VELERPQVAEDIATTLELERPQLLPPEELERPQPPRLELDFAAEELDFTASEELDFGCSVPLDM